MNTPEYGPGIASPEEMAAFHRRRDAELRKEAEAKKKEKQRAQEAALEAERKESEQLIAAEKARLKDEWIRAGGTATEFAAEWPNLRTGLLIERIADKEGRTAADIRDIWRYSS
jgi:hypothetical protein